MDREGSSRAKIPGPAEDAGPTDRPEVAAVGRSGAAEGLRGRLVAAGPWPIEQEARQVTHPTNKPGPQAGLVIWWLLAALPIVL